MTYPCVIIEDDILAISHLKRLIYERTDLEISNTFTKVNELKKFADTCANSIVFLDIFLPKTRGTDLANYFIARNEVIFTTSSTEFALGAIKLVQ